MLRLSATFRTISVAVLLLPGCLLAASVNLGGVAIEIPSPFGYVSPKSPNSLLTRMARATDTADFKTLADLYPATFEEQLESGKAQQAVRHYLARIPMSLVALAIELQHFAQAKSNMRRACVPRDDASRAIQVELEAANARIGEVLGRNPQLAIGTPVPLPIHEDTANSIACSFVMKVRAPAPDGSDITETMAFTSVDIYVSKKLLMLTVYGAAEDLEWTRAAAKDWAGMIIKANAGATVKAAPQVQR